jgi:hypothetical protein
MLKVNLENFQMVNHQFYILHIDLKLLKLYVCIKRNILHIL